MTDSGIFSFVVVNVDTALTDAEIAAYARAQQRQILEHWAPFWRTWGIVRADIAANVKPGEIPINLLHSPTQSAALGFHDRQADGTPIGNVFSDLARAEGDAWTSVASHEVLEILGDPYLMTCVEIDGEIWDREVCDRVEGDTYVLDQVTLSNFNTPAAFEPSRAGKDRYDYLGLSKTRNEVRPGGYAQKRDPSKGWQQVGQMRGYRAELARLGFSRGARRARL